jgi:hypothetical protein
MRLLLIGVLALVMAGSAGAGPTKQKLVRVVKRHGAITATLTYTLPGYDRVTLAVRRHGRVVLKHRVSDMGPMTPLFTFRYVAGKQVPGVVVDTYLSTAIALISPHPAWIAHNWSRSNYRGERVGGRYYFATGDGRFWCTYASCADSWAPAQIWAIRREQLVDVTKTVPALVHTDAHKAWQWYLRVRHGRGRAGGIAVLAGWCADEYTLGRAVHCNSILRQKLAAGELKAPGALSGRKFIRTLHRDLARWGYTRR